MISLLNYFPPMVVLFGLTSIITAFCIGLTLLIRYRGWTLIQEHSDSAAAIYSFVGIAYGVLLGFVVVSIWEHYREVEEAIMKEANAVGDLYRNLDGINQASSKHFQLKLQNYLNQVINEEWPIIQNGGRNKSTRAFIEDLARELIDFHPAADHEALVYRKLLSDMDGVLNERRQRIFLGTHGIRTDTWVVIVAGAVITLGFACFFPFNRLRTHLLSTGAMAAVFGFIISLIVLLDTPLLGRYAIQPDAFIDLCEHLYYKK